MQDPRLIQLALKFLDASGAARILAPAFRGRGAILMLHHVRPGGGTDTGFAPNRGLEITPEFLAAVIDHVRARGYEIISLAHAVERLRTGDSGRPFVVLTLDDGYQDNIDHAVPVFRVANAPYTIFFAPAITDGTCELWWRILELAIRDNDAVQAEIEGERLSLSAQTAEQKMSAFMALYWPVRRMEEHEQRRWIRRFASAYEIDVDLYCRSVAMDWDAVRTLAEDPLCTIGAHTINHYAVARLPAEEALAEMRRSADRLAAETGVRPQFFAYPYGDEGSAGPRDFDLAVEAGFTAAVTTAKGVIKANHAGQLTGLPRLSLNGDYQRLDYLDVLLGGLPFAARDLARTLLRR